MSDDLGPWGICDRSGMKFRQSDMFTEWNGLRVAKRFSEARHPQDFLRAIPDNPSIPNARPEQTPVFLTPGDVTASDL